MRKSQGTLQVILSQPCFPGLWWRLKMAMWLREPYGLQSAADMDRAAIFPATLPVLLESSTPCG